MAIDVEDIHLDDGYIDFVHRPGEGTTLMSGQSGERPVAITEGFLELIEAFNDTKRTETVDEDGRKPGEIHPSIPPGHARSSPRQSVL